jgi:signal transduction histidine kinase/DNA-binding response OmpR family regulator
MMAGGTPIDDFARLAVENCPTGLIMLDGAGRIAMANAAIATLFGYARDEVIGQRLTMLVPEPPDRISPQGLFGRRKDDSDFPVDVSRHPVAGHDGQWVLAAIVDASERKRHERMKNEFVSTVSHELRTPLTSIAGSLALLVGGAAGALPETALRLLTIAHKNSERLVRLINDILDIEKIEAGEVVFDLKRIDAGALVDQAIDASRSFAEKFGVHLTLLHSDVPAEVRADSDRLLQAVTNLLSNAVKFSPREAEVRVTLAPQGDMVRINVRDHGPGIPPDFRARIFEKFAQADTSDTRQKGGTGLGLSIVRQIMLRLGGDVGFADAVGGGTVFYLDVPRWKPAFDTPRIDRPRVLLCEDDAVAAHALASRVAQAGFCVETAATAEGAIGRAAESAFAAILVDLQLPDSDGITLIQALRALPAHHNTPIVVVSADPNRGRSDLRSSNLNVLDWLEKPVDIRRLMNVLDRPIVRGASVRPRILHVDDDAAVLGIVAQALDATADVVSVDSLEGARQALRLHRFDLAVLDVALAADSGLDLLPELRDSEGDAIPVVVFSAQGANRLCATRVQQALTKSRASIDHLISILSKGLDRQTSALPDKEVA